MAKYTQYKASELVGRNIYHVKNQTIYYDTLDKTAYIITNSEVKDFTSWQMRAPLCVVIACVMVLLGANVFISIGVGFFVYGIATVLFHKTFLPKLSVSTSFKRPPSLGFFKDIATRYSETTLKIMVSMFVVMAIVMFVVSFVINHYTDHNAAIAWVFIVISLIAAGFMFYILKVKKKNNL